MSAATRGRPIDFDAPARSLISDLAAAGVSLRVVRGKLYLDGPDDILTDEALALIRPRKRDLVAAIRSGDGPVADGRELVERAAVHELARVLQWSGFEAYRDNTPDREEVVLWGRLLFAAGGVDLMRRVYGAVGEAVRLKYARRPRTAAGIMADLERRWDGIGRVAGRIGTDIWMA